MDLKRTVKWIDKTQGRDKFCKAIQYACRFMKDHAEKSGNKDFAKKCNALFMAMRDARKLFRLFKSINEFQKILEILNKQHRLPELTLGILSRIGFLLYWTFDNISILRKIGVINGDSKTVSQKGSTCWLIALLFTLISTVKSLIFNQRELSQRQKEYRSAPNEREVQDNRKAYLDLQLKRKQIVLTLLKTLGDMIPAAQGSEILNSLGIPASDRLCGFGGLVSAVITSYQLYD